VKEVEGAMTGPEAIRKLSGRKRYDLVMCERFMLPMNALDLKLLMNSRPEWAGIPFIAMLSVDKAGDAEKRAAAGVDHAIIKPFTADALMKVVTAATSSRAAAA
jgi:CheY-like chemotaxis protein